LGDTSTPDGSSDFPRQVQEILEDPKVIAFAVRRVGRELAKDVLQSAYLHIISVQHPEDIRNLRSYCFTTVANEIRALYALTQPVLVDDVETLTSPEPSPALYGAAPERAVVDQACTAAQTQVWLDRHAARRGELIAKIPARSANPARYREVIYAAAKQAFFCHLSLEPNDPAFPEVLKEVYPEYFDAQDVMPNTLHQRISRARDDIKATLQLIIKRDELY
jgi:DNA-directed RNA polymerase specialized sigma24 family protein